MPKKRSKGGKRRGSSGGVRDVIRECPHRVVGEVAWPKGGDPTNVPWESRPERDALKILAADARVCRALHQPFFVHYELDGVLHKHIPDYKVDAISRPFILEVKELAEAKNEENQARLPEVTRVLATEGLDYRVWTEQEYRREPLLSNSNYVLRFRNYPFEEHLVRDVVRLLAKHSCLRVSALHSLLGSTVSTDALFAMVCFGYIYVDCNKPFGADPIFSEVPKDGSLPCT